MGIKSRARAGDGGVSDQLSPDKPYSKRKVSPSKKGILRRAMGFFRYRLIGSWTPFGRIYADPEFFETGNGFCAKVRHGEFVYRGHVKDWKYNGHGIMKSRVDGYRFEGEFKDNLPNGKGKEIEADGRVIECNWVNGEPSGRATVHYPDGSIYVGNLKHTLPNGKGLLKTNDESETEYEGYWKDGVLTGPGVVRNKFGFSLEGSFINGQPNPFTEHTVFFPENEEFFFKGTLTDDGYQPMNGSVYNIGNGVEFYTGEFDALSSKGRGTMFYQKMTQPLPFPSHWISYAGEMENLIPNGYGEFVISGPELFDDRNVVATQIGNFVGGVPIGEVIFVCSKQEEGGEFRDFGKLELRIDGDVHVDSSESPPISFIVQESLNVDIQSMTDFESGATWGEEQASKVLKIMKAFIDESFRVPKENQELVNELIASVVETNDRNMLHGGIEQLLRDDEGQNLEFKASIWSNYNSSIEEFIPRGNGKGEQKDKNWNLQDSVIKTIAGFRNAEGGTLLIGVEDKVKKSKGKLARVLGIQSDFRWTKNEDQESYDHALREALRESMSDKLVELHSNDVIKITYPEFDGKEICRVDVKGIPHGEEGHIWAKTKNLGKDTFFVRSSDSTRPLTGSEAHEYILGRLKKKRYE